MDVETYSTIKMNAIDIVAMSGAAYYRHGKDDSFLLDQIRNAFAQIAPALGYRLEEIELEPASPERSHGLTPVAAAE